MPDQTPAQPPKPARERKVALDPITDGSCPLIHDALDVQAWEDAMADYPNVAQAVENIKGRLATGDALLRDTFMSFNKRAPIIDPMVPMKEEYEINKQILEQLHQTREYESARLAGTPGDAMLSAMATLTVSQSMIQALPEETVDAINRLSELQKQAEELFNTAEALEDLASQAQDPKAADLHARAQELRARLQDVEEEAQQVAPQAQLSEEQQDAMRLAARQACQSAEQQVEEISSAMEAFSGGPGRGIGSGQGGSTMAGPERLKLATKIQKNRKLQEIAAMCGRMQRIALQVQATKLEHGPDEITEIETGREIDRILSSELLLLADEELEVIFGIRYIEEKMNQYRLERKEKQGQGPIVVALDSSGSMQGEKEAWSKGVALGLLAIAKKQGRDFMAMHFSSSNELKVHTFPKGEAGPKELLEFAEFFYGGGTEFEPWMKKSLVAVDQAKFNRADVIVISDGEAQVSEAMRQEWNRRRKEKEMRCYAVLIGDAYGGHMGGQVLAGISDALMDFKDLQGEEMAVLDTVFGV